MATTELAPVTTAPALSPKAETAFRVVTTISVGVLALMAAVLSYSGLKKAALDAAVDPNLAWIFPIVIDGLTFVGSVGVVYAVLTRTSSWYPWLLTLLGVGISVTGNIAVSPDDPISRMVHAAPPVVLALSLEALLRVYRARAHSLLTTSVSKKERRTHTDSPTTVSSITTPPARTEGERSANPEDNQAPTRVPPPAKEVAAPAPVHPVIEPVLEPAGSHTTAPQPVADQVRASPTPVTPAAQPRPVSPDQPAPTPTRTTVPPASPTVPVATPGAMRPLTTPAQTPASPVSTGSREVDPFATAAPVRTTAPTTPTAPALSPPAPGGSEPTARVRIQAILRSEPNIGGAEVARRLNIDPSYARRILRELRDDSQDTEDASADDRSPASVSG